MAETDKPYSTGIFETIVGVNFDDGLAVEINPPRSPVSYLEGGVGANLSKAVVSVWFRIPAETAARAASNHTTGTDYAVLETTIPLFTFGPQYTGQIYEWDFPLKTFLIPATPNPVGPYSFRLGFVTGSHSATTPPSFVGVRCSGAGAMSLAVNVQTPNHPSCQATATDTTDVSGEWNLVDAAGDGYASFNYTSSDVSYASEGGYEYFGNAGYSGQELGVWGSPAINGTDVWHHVILSWDVTPGADAQGTGTPDRDLNFSKYITRYSKMWCAVDDVNQSGYNLPADWVFADTGAGDPNAMVSSFVGTVAGTPEAILPQYNSGLQFDFGGTNYDFGNPHATLAVSSIPLAPLRIPSLDTLVGASGLNYDIELAELQIWAGVTLDTSSASARRLLITQDGKPETNYEAVDQALGPPVVRLHRTGNWKKGKNTGYGSNLEPTGDIIKFKPDPQLGKG